MGSGSYSRDDFISYTASRGISYDSSTCKMADFTSHQDIFKSRSVDPALNPMNVTRECCDSAEHPNTKPVILALDVTGSMGQAAVEVAKSMNVIMTKLYDQVDDIQFMTMGIGDFSYDHSPLQVSQFESDIRIVEQLDKIYFEFGGGGNSFESYSAAWKFGLDHTKLDCFDKRGQKGVIITLGDERLNPYINRDAWNAIVGDSLQADIETKNLYEEVSKKFNIFHINVDHKGFPMSGIEESFKAIIPAQNYFKCKIEDLDKTISNIIIDSFTNSSASSFVVNENPIPAATLKIGKNENGEICW